MDKLGMALLIRHCFKVVGETQSQTIIRSGIATAGNWRCFSTDPKSCFEEFGLLLPGHFSFEVGAPNPKYLNAIAKYLKIASNEVAARNDVAHTLQYGCLAGTISVRKEFANFLTRQYKSCVEWESIFVTCGATSGLGVLLQHLFDADQVLFAENPTYPIFAKLYSKEPHMKPVPITIESDGLDLECFEKELRKLPIRELTKRRPFKAAAYLIPTYHNPTGCCYSTEKCKKLVELAREHDVLIICDDVYNTLSYETDPSNPGKFLPSPSRLYAYDCKNHYNYKGNVVSNGSFAKIIAPGLRLGWYEAPQRIIDVMRGSYLIESGGGQSAYISTVVAEALKSGAIDDHVNALQVAHKERMEAAIEVVERNLAKYGVTISHPSGGYFLWVKLPSEINSGRVWEISKATENVTFVRGNVASLCGDFANYLRLSIAYYEANEIKDGTEKLCRAIAAAINEKPC